MRKILNLRRLNLALTIRVIGIYLKKIWKRKITGDDFALLSYYNILIKCDLEHLTETQLSYEATGSESPVFVLRKFPSSDAQVLKQIWADEEYKIVVDIIKDNIETDTLRVIDAGANVGYSTVYLNHFLRDKYVLDTVAIEPDESNVAILKKNLERNNMHRSKIERAGLYNKSCYLKVVNDFRDGREWSLQVKEVDYPTEILGIQLDDICGKYNWNSVDFFKIDIEGAEKYLFSSPEYANSFLSKVKIISIEIHQEVNIKEIIDEALTRNNFQCVEHGELTIGVNRNLVKK